MNLQSVFCPNRACRDKYEKGKGNVVAHSQKRQRCKGRSCGHTFSYRQGTMFYGLRYPAEQIMWVVGLVACGCPVAAIVTVFEIDERTVADWMCRAGQYAEGFHHQHIRPIDLQQVQVDEIRLKMQRQVVMGGDGNQCGQSVMVRRGVSGETRPKAGTADYHLRVQLGTTAAAGDCL